MEHRWQVQRWDGEHEGEWVDAEPPVDAKVLDLAAQIIELEAQVKYWEDERGQFMDDAWKAAGRTGEYPYGGVILMEIEALAKERAEAALQDVITNANAHSHRKPNIRTLTEEFCEAFLAFRGKHDDPLRLELVQIAGVCINMIRQIDAGEDFKP